MNKILSLFTVSVIIFSILASVSPTIKNQIISVVGNNNYASSIIPIPDFKSQNVKLAKHKNQNNSSNKSVKHSREIMDINFIE